MQTDATTCCMRKLLHACWKWCANGCNNSQQCWDLQSIVGRIQPIISLCKPCVMSVRGRNNRELKIETFSGRRQLQPDVTSSWVGYCACSCSPPCRRGPVGDVKLGCLALWRKSENLTFISIRFVTFSNQNFADYRS